MLHSEADNVRGHPVPSKSPNEVSPLVQESSTPSSMRTSQVLLLLILCVLMAPVLFGLGMWLQYEYVTKPRTLKEAGRIELKEMNSALPPESILPAALGEQNGAAHYVLALNSFNQRRGPYLAKLGLNPYLQEPKINADELRELWKGAQQRDAYLCEQQNRVPRFVFYIMPGHKKWAFRPSTDPFELRPYTGPVRALAQSALNWGKDRENAGLPGDAEWVYQNVSRFGKHLWSRPGAFLDIELGLEIESKALHYLESLYKSTRRREKEVKCHQYAGSVADLQRRVRSKFAQLDNPEAAKEVMLHDTEPVWRITAAVALVSAEHYDKLDFTQLWSARFAIRRAKRDPNRYVRLACYALAAMKDKDFRAPEVQSGPVE